MNLIYITDVNEIVLQLQDSSLLAHDEERIYLF